MFKKRESVTEIEEGSLLSPKFDNDGLIPVVTTCVNTKEILMLGYMNVEALKKQLKLRKRIIGADQGNKFGTKVKHLDLFKK